MKKIIFIGVFFIIFGCNRYQKDTQNQSPNVVFIYVDDLGYGDISSYGGTIATPHIDKLADHGILHRNAYAAASTCTPSRYTLLTGEYAWREKGRGVIDGDAQALIPKGRQTVASVFKKAGYTTAVVGKWHLGLGDYNGIDWNKPITKLQKILGLIKVSLYLLLPIEYHVSMCKIERLSILILPILSKLIIIIK